MDEGRLASLVFEGVMGREAPTVDMSVYPDWARFEFVVGVQDGSKPFYVTPPQPSPQARRGLSASGRVVELNLHGGQVRAWEADERFVAIIAGKQGGKTTFGPLWLHREIQRGGAGDYLAVSATYDLLTLKMLPALKAYFVDVLGIGKYHAGDRILEIRNPYTGDFAPNASSPEKMWARIILRSADSESGMQSATGLAAWLDEAGLYPPSVFKDVRGRLSLNRGRILITTTPYNMGWLKGQIYDRRDDANYLVIQFASIENPFFSREEYDDLRGEMSKYQFAMDYKGEFENPPGLIYADFVHELEEYGGHLCKPFVIPNDWERVCAIDPGEVNPGKLWFALNPASGVWYCYREELGQGRKTSKEHAADDIAMIRGMGERIKWWAIGAKSEKYWRDDYKGAGARNVREPKVTDVEEGIDRCSLLIRTHGVVFFESLKATLGQFEDYKRELDKRTQEPTMKIEDKSKFHLMDAFRYFAPHVVNKRTETRVGRTARAI